MKIFTYIIRYYVTLKWFYKRRIFIIKDYLEMITNRSNIYLWLNIMQILFCLIILIVLIVTEKFKLKLNVHTFPHHVLEQAYLIRIISFDVYEITALKAHKLPHLFQTNLNKWLRRFIDEISTNAVLMVLQNLKCFPINYS